MENDILFLKNLQKNLWPENHKNNKFSLLASRELTKEEFTQLDTILKSNSFVIVIINTNMFGGYGIDIYEHELYPGIGPRFILRIIEGHLPCPIYEKKIPGRGSDFAWEYFSKYAQNKNNIEWCKKYKLYITSERDYYDY